jgi:hypothetical protein
MYRMDERTLSQKAMSKLGKIGALARQRALSPERRREIAIKASKAAAKARTRKAKERKAANRGKRK